MAAGVSKDAARGDMKKLNLDAAQLVAGTARGLVPVRSGRLQGSIRASGTQRSSRVRAGFKRVPYAGVTHFGWPARGIRPQTFLYDALDARRGEVLRAYEKGLEDIKRRYELGA